METFRVDRSGPEPLFRRYRLKYYFMVVFNRIRGFMCGPALVYYPRVIIEYYALVAFVSYVDSVVAVKPIAFQRLCLGCVIPVLA